MDRRRVWSLMVLASSFALVVALCAPAVAVANDSSIGGAGMNVKPVASTTIRMVAETVQVIAFQQYAEYQIDFQFENKGAARRVRLGFPFPVPIGQDHTPHAGFQAWRGEKLLPVTYQVIGTGDFRLGYYLHEAVFPTGTTMIRVRYYASPDSGIGDDLPKHVAPPARFAGSRSDWGAYPYTVSTGAGWAGTIGTSVIRYYVSPDALLWGVDLHAKQDAAEMANDDYYPAGARKIFLSYAKPAPGIYQWKFTNYEPRPNTDDWSPYDIEMPFYLPVPDYESDTVPPWAPYATVKESSELDLGGSTYPADQALDGVPSSAWAEGVPGPGTGQFFKVTFPEDRHVREIRVLPGYAKTAVLFHKYNRPKTLSVEFSDGTKVKLRLADTPDVQKFAVDTYANWAKVTIGDVYRGTTRDETYLSEIEFGTAKAPVMMSFRDVLAGKLPAPGTTVTTTGTVTKAHKTAPAHVATPVVTGGAVTPRTLAGRTGANWGPLALTIACAVALGFVAWAGARRRRRVEAAAVDESQPPSMP